MSFYVWNFGLRPCRMACWYCMCSWQVDIMVLICPTSICPLQSLAVQSLPMQAMDADCRQLQA